jgi:CspA family cold shock protein
VLKRRLDNVANPARSRRSEAMPKGIIKFFNDYKGYGFIQSSDTKNIFVHFSAIDKEGYRTLREGQEVSFDLREGQHGLEAERVKVI